MNAAHAAKGSPPKPPCSQVQAINHAVRPQTAVTIKLLSIKLQVFD